LNAPADSIGVRICMSSSWRILQIDFFDLAFVTMETVPSLVGHPWLHVDGLKSEFLCCECVHKTLLERSKRR
jgi:hypothetical protein